MQNGSPLPPVTEDELILATPAKRPIMAPRPGDDLLVGSRRGPVAPAHIVKIRRIVGFTREWTSLALVSFDVDTEDGIRTISAIPDPGGVWIERRASDPR